VYIDMCVVSFTAAYLTTPTISVDDPICKVSASVAAEFQEVTGCVDMTVCRRFVTKYSMNLSDAVNAYFDHC